MVFIVIEWENIYVFKVFNIFYINAQYSLYYQNYIIKSSNFVYGVHVWNRSDQGK